LTDNYGPTPHTPEGEHQGISLLDPCTFLSMP